MNAGRREALILGAAGLGAAAAGFVAGPRLLELGSTSSGRDDGYALFASSFPDLHGKARPLAEWRGKVLVVNFWATWCTPCIEEIPLLSAAWKKYRDAGVEIVGIAIDNGAKVVEFTRTVPISYPILLAEQGGIDLMRRLKNTSGGLPYTVIVDRRERLVHRKLGVLKAGDLESILPPLIKA
jgi:thiol-disulfide isomerase/thioredoxin